MTPSKPASRTDLTLRRTVAAFALSACAIAPVAAAPTMVSTSAADHWQVAVNLGAPDGQATSFQTSSFQSAVSISGRTTDGIGWIANNSSGTNGSIGYWSFFVFRQEIDLTGYDPATVSLTFEWAADDSGQGFADRGTWIPQFRLNGGAFQTSFWAGGSTYGFSSPTTLSSGFVAGKNIIDFYVEGNGVTDGFALRPISFTAAPVPEPEVSGLVAAGLMVAMAGLWRRRKPTHHG
ncbi:MAG TPA: PEP-CTERM sorting domain-containing protein [Aquabacterium sp.]|nr:PEP-CTERM sorting domain-containing protein [Aquabacterium sp.]